MFKKICILNLHLTKQNNFCNLKWLNVLTYITTSYVKGQMRD